ncbi:MAG: copper homeostasis protein CutC [Bacteroidaceae bacterium]|nr:copper homeostasis protein CutC [Bacteroidaceae bacterium]
MSPHPILEVCCGSLGSAEAAVEGGACRIELCAALSLDGLTPSIGLVRELRRRFPDLLIHVLIRPREGDFVYSEAELQVMEADIRAAIDAGASAIVSGALTAESTVDEDATARLVCAAAGLPFTFHRAFDSVRDPFSALRQLHALGVRRILTSGGAPTAEVGIPVLRRLVEQAATLSSSPSNSSPSSSSPTISSPLNSSPSSSSPLTILPGGGVNRHNAARILRETGATEIHGSCSITLPSGLRQTSADEVRAVLCHHEDML